MIIKRRVTRQFVQLENALVRDRRLSLDEHGMLHYLLSLPDDWEVTQGKCAKFWNIGREKCSRIFKSLRRTGWAQYDPIYADDGVTFIGKRWIIGDEPGPEPDPTTIETADDTETDDEPANEAAAPESKGPAVGASITPPRLPENPECRKTRNVGKPGLSENPTTQVEERKSLENRLSTNITTTARETDDDDGEPPPKFGELLRLWPRDNVISAFACEKLFAKFTDRHKRDAFTGIKPYLDDYRIKGHNRLCDLRTYLDERRWERFTSKGPAGKSLFVVQRGTPEAGRWHSYLKQHAPDRLSVFSLALAGRGYTAPSQWPPASDPGADRSGAEGLLSADDEQFLAEGGMR